MGGKSSRMGTDKAQLTYKNKTLFEIAQAKLRPFCNHVFCSINKNQQELPIHHTILDRYVNEGPLSGILTSLLLIEEPIIFLGVDMPHISSNTICRLVGEMKQDEMVTSCFNPEKQLWEGMLSIWQPTSIDPLVEYFEDGGRSLQKFLYKIDAQKMEVSDTLEFNNINTPKDYKNLGS